VIRALVRGWWRIRTAARLAGRELRHSPRQGALVAALVALPVAAMVLVGTVISSQAPTAQERVSAELGSAESWVRIGDMYGCAVVQSPTEPLALRPRGESRSENGCGSMDSQSEPLMGEDVTALLPQGGTRIVITHGSVVAESESGIASADAIEGEAWDPALRGPFVVDEGRAPQAANEVMVSHAFLDALDIAVGDAVSLDGYPGLFVVTGVLSTRVDWGDPVLYASPGTLGLMGDPETIVWYLIDRSLTWAEIQELNTYGLIAYSRAVVENPPPVDPVIQQYGFEAASPAIFAVAGVGVGAVLLLAGAGFAVTFRRQRRTMAILAATGAERGSLVGVGVARGAWLGLVGGVVGAGLGLVAAWVWFTAVTRWGSSDDQNSTWGYHIMSGQVAAAIAYGLLLGALAALIPAIAAARLDVVAVMRGSQRPSRSRAWPVVLGVVSCGVGVVLLAAAARQYTAALDLSGLAAYELKQRAGKLLFVGMVASFLGACALAARAIRGIAHAMERWGVAPRLAARDLARHGGRTVPIVAAIAITIAIASTVLLTLDRDQRIIEASWHTEVPVGDGYAHLSSLPESVDGERLTRELAEVVDQIVPGADVAVINGWIEPIEASDATAVPSFLVPTENLCPWGDELSERERVADPRCSGPDANLGEFVFQASVGDYEDLVFLLGGLPEANVRDALATGSVVVFSEALMRDGEVTIGFWDYTTGNYAGMGDAPARTIRLPAVYAGGPPEWRQNVVFMSPETAATVAWRVGPEYLLVDAPEAITLNEQSQLNGALRRVTGSSLWFAIGRGVFAAFSPVVLAIIIGSVLALVAGCTGIALGLARADARQDDFTLASLGASPRLARTVAAWQGAIIVFVATTIGVACGLAWMWVDAHRIVEGAPAPPWSLVSIVYLGLPVVVAIAAALFTRVPGTAHSRLTV